MSPKSMKPMTIPKKARKPLDQVTKAENGIHDQKPLCFAVKMKRNFVKIRKSSSNSLEIVVKIERDPHFRFHELVPGNDDGFGGSKIHEIRDKH